MATLTIAKLNFNSPLHLSKGKPDSLDVSEEIIHSDTIKSAMYAVGLQLYEMDKSFLKHFQVSSAFPYYENELFFPKPMAQLPFGMEKYSDEEESKTNKSLKKIQYIGKDFFELALKNDSQKTQIKDSDFLDKKKQFISRNIEGKDIVVFKKSTSQRVRVPKMGEARDAEPFRVEKIFFAEKAGLHFIIHINEDAPQGFKSKLENIIRLLGENGIGTNKNLGCGCFDFNEFETTTLQLPDVTENTKWTAMSLYLPGDKSELAEAFTGEKMSYSLVKRGGWVASPQEEQHLSNRKRSVYMFAEGSVFNFNHLTNSILIKGNIVDLMPESWKGFEDKHPVYRDGSCIFLPINN